MFAARNSKNNSSDETVRMLLEHESGKDVARMQAKDGSTALMLAARNSATSTPSVVARLCPHARDTTELMQVGELCAEGFSLYCVQLHQSTQERQALSAALKAGINLPGAITLLYL